MPRSRRLAVGGMVFHVLNRGNDCCRIFHKDADYAAFLGLLLDGRRHANIDIFAYCLMPNHWHLVVRPRGDHDLAAYIGWVCNTHVKRYRLHYQTLGHGHVYQGRYKSFPVQTDEHLLSVLSYVEANPLRAGLVARAEQWPWSSLGASETAEARKLLSDWPIARPADWIQCVNSRLTDAQLEAVRNAITRGRPYGAAEWVAAAARTLGLEQTLRSPGRPMKKAAAIV